MKNLRCIFLGFQATSCIFASLVKKHLYWVSFMLQMDTRNMFNSTLWCKKQTLLSSGTKYLISTMHKHMNPSWLSSFCC